MRIHISLGGCGLLLRCDRCARSAWTLPYHLRVSSMAASFSKNPCILGNSYTFADRMS